MTHIRRKRFGQHFLRDGYIIQQSVDAIAPQIGEHLVEIGPGEGVLTYPLLEKIGTAGRLDAIEIDRDLIHDLQTIDHPQFFLHQADALFFDFGELADKTQSLRVVGNLPYNISTPLIFHLLTFANKIKDMHFMLQKEVVERLAATPRTKNYGRLSIMAQYYCKITALFDVPPDAFSPPPKVNSAVVRLVPYQTLPYPAKDFEHFQQLVKTAFSMRRKTLRNALKNTIDSPTWERLQLDANLRPEEFTVEEFVRLSNA